MFFEEENPLPYLGLLTTQIVKYLLKSFLSHGVETGEEALKALPIFDLNQTFSKTEITRLVSSIIEKQKIQPRYPYHLHEQREIDKIVGELYGLDENDLREVAFWHCRRYPKLSKAQGLWEEVHTQYADYLGRAAFLLAKPPGYWRSHPVYERISEGEGQKLDFKRFLGVDINGVKSDKSADSVMKAIAGFLNAEGGTILIGVADNGQTVGIALDLKHVTHKNHDGFELKLRTLMDISLSQILGGLVKVTFETLPEGVVCVVEVSPALGVTYFKDSVYLRDGNRTVTLEGRKLVEWLQTRK